MRVASGESWTCGSRQHTLLPEMGSSALITITVDMETHRLSFAVDSGAAVECGITLPAAVRLWACPWHRRASFSIASNRFEARRPLQFFAPAAASGGFIIEAVNIGGDVLAEVPVQVDSTWDCLKTQLPEGWRYFCDGEEMMDTPDKAELKTTALSTAFGCADGQVVVEEDVADATKKVEVEVHEEMSEEAPKEA